MDFGIARVRGVEHITVDGCLMGTPAYISPEHVRGEAVDERADLYAVGVIFYRLLTGKLPFDADSTVVMLQKHVSERPTALREHRPDLPRWCDVIVQRAMAKVPAERFQTASEFRSALRRAAAAAPAGSRAARTRQSTIVLSGAAAKVMRHSAVSATPARPSSSATARWPLAVASIALVASLVLLAHVTARAPGSPRVVRPAPVVKMRAPTPVHTEIAQAKPEAVVVPALRKTYPARAFVTKGLVENGRDRRVRDVRLVLSDNSLTVSDDATRHRLQMVPFDDVRAITYSHGRDPMWNSSRGPTPIVRTSGRFSRAFGFGTKRHWISLMTRTDRRFVIFGVNDSQVADVLSALEERTGQTPQLVESRKGAD
jgi:serine/threonine protein kinase